MSFTLCIVLIKHHACIDDEVHEDAVVEEEPQAREPADEPIDVAQGKPLCIPMLC
jgi:hypothetical protein